ncbi:MAG: hypothetical protein ACD_29C00099G0001 [uncultured bacterium]|nr:MAG: hypothetical protein ACD_29C00099G0001 [uncultured bacterium]
MDVINAIAKRYNVPVIEDAAQSFGATYKNRKSCNISEIACTSFFPSKPLGAYGDGGACFTNDTALAKKMRLIINHGQDVRYHHVALGMNGRMDTLQAAILLEKLKFFDHEVKQRQQVANWYHDGLTAINIQPPIILDYNNSVYAQYTIQVDHRDLVQKKLSELDIPTAVHYPIGLHQQPYVRTQHKQDVQSFPVTELCAKRVLSLPFYPSMSREDVEIVCERLKSVMN